MMTLVYYRHLGVSSKEFGFENMAQWTLKEALNSKQTKATTKEEKTCQKRKKDDSQHPIFLLFLLIKWRQMILVTVPIKYTNTLFCQDSFIFYYLVEHIVKASLYDYFDSISCDPPSFPVIFWITIAFEGLNWRAFWRAQFSKSDFLCTVSWLSRNIMI